MKKIFFTEEDAQILKDTVINRKTPGTIVQDFNSLIEYIQTNQVKITKRTDYFSLKQLAPMNEILSHPIKLNLNRPSQKSFPNLRGIFLLLRGTGIIKIKNIGREKYCQIDNTVLDEWSNLNDTEAFFTLLETWLIRSNPRDLFGEEGGNVFIVLTDCYKFWKIIPKRGLEIKKNKAESLKYFPGLFNVALLEIFGLIDIVHGIPERGTGWKIEKIKRNKFGDGVFRLLSQYLITTQVYINFSVYNTTELRETIPFGQLQKLFQPFFPEWQSNLIIPKPELRNGTYLFKVSLDNDVWRRIEIDSKMTLEQLVDTILDVFEFDKDHLYAFYFRDRFGNLVEVNSPFAREGVDTTEIEIGELPLEINSYLKFVYDFGDYWEFWLRLEKIDQTDIKLRQPKITESHGKAPKQYPSWDEDDDFI